MFLCLVHCIAHSKLCRLFQMTPLEKNNADRTGSDWTDDREDDGYLQTASSGKAQLLLKEREKESFIYLDDHCNVRQYCHFVHVKQSYVVSLQQVQYSRSTNRCHCDTTCTGNTRSCFSTSEVFKVCYCA